MAPSSKRGALIVIEGLDRAGKSTQHSRLCQRLESEGHSVKSLRFPDRSTILGQAIDAYLQGRTQQEDHAIHLLFSANRWEAADQITASIEAGTTVVIDRYYYSGIVFSVAKNRPDLTLQWARQPEVGLPRPDLCLFLDIVPDVAASRGGYGNEKYETSSMQKRVRELFMDLLQGEDGEDVRIIDAGRSAEDVEKDVVKLVDETMTGKVLQTQLRTISP